MAGSAKGQRVVVVGAGFAGFNAARELARLASATTEIVVINSTDYFLYLPLMPQVASGLIDSEHIRAAQPRRLRKTRFVLGKVNHIDAKQKVVEWQGPEGTDPARRGARHDGTARPAAGQAGGAERRGLAHRRHGPRLQASRPGLPGCGC